MHELVDIYGKLVIAVLGFIAPTVTLLLPILQDRVSIIRMRLTEQERITETIQQSILEDYKNNISNIQNAQLAERLVRTIVDYSKKSTAPFKKVIDDLKRQLKFLNLKRQIKWIFICLILSLVFVMAYHLVKVNLYGCFGLSQNIRLYISLLLLLLSVISFSMAVWRLWRIMCIIIDDKSEPINVIKNPNNDSSGIPNTAL